MKKLLSIVLALAMLLTLVVMPAGAIEGTYVAYYVGDTIDGDAVTGLTAGATYTPDRMPTAEAPAGQYFVGWADSTGKIVPNGGITLAEGENKLTAVYKSFAAETVVDLSRHTAGGALTSNIGYMKNGTYRGQVTARSSGAPKAEYITDEQTGETYLQVSPNSPKDPGGTGFPLVDADGDVIQGKWSTKYKIVMEFRIPENEGTMSMHANFGGKIYDASVTYNQAPLFTNKDKNALGVVLLGQYVAAAGYVGKWHDNGGYYNIFNNSGTYNPATVEDWATATFNITTGAQDDNYLPIFIVAVNTDTNTVAQKFQIKSIKVIDTTIADVQYVVNGEVMATVSGLTAGATYTPDRMPTTETPAGKYFVGWADKNGNIVNSGTAKAPLGITLEYGNNTLTAVYKDYEQNYLLNPGVNKPTYYAYMDSTSRYTATLDVTYDQSAALQTDGSMFIYNNNQEWSATSIVPISANDSAALYAESNSTYKITVEYKATVVDVEALYQSSIANVTVGYPETNAVVSITAGIGKSTSKADNRSFIASSPSTITHTENTDWLTQEFTVTTGNSVGAFPIFGLKIASGALPHSPGYNEDGSRKGAQWSGTKTYGTNGIYVKSVKIEKVVANVQYIVGDTVESTVENLVVGSEFTPDRMPTAEAPEGKYFAGWKYNGEYVVDAITLAAGENKLEAVYKDFPTAVSASTNMSDLTGGKVVMPSVDENGENYLSTLANLGYGQLNTVTENGENHLVYNAHSTTTWAETRVLTLFDEDGAAIQVKPGTAYTVALTYKVAEYDKQMTMAVFSGFARSARAGSGYVGDNDPAQTIPGYAYTNDANVKNDWVYNELKTGGYDIARLNGGSDEWKTIAFEITTGNFNGYLPVLNLFVGHNSGASDLVIKDIKISEGKFYNTTTIGDKSAEYIKIAENVEDKATYKVNLRLSVHTGGTICAMTAEPDDITRNQGFVEAANYALLSLGWTDKSHLEYSFFVTIDMKKVDGVSQGDALYLYFPGGEKVKCFNFISIEKVEGVKNGGVSMLAGAKQTDKQALRYYFSYNTENGNDIVIDGETYTIASRGFLLADADNVGDKAVTRTTAAEKDSGIIDANTTELTKCWGYTDNGDGTAKLEFSTYITGFIPDGGTYNNTNKLYVKGYVVLENGSVIYSEESKMTVADVANLINAGGGRVH